VWTLGGAYDFVGQSPAVQAHFLGPLLGPERGSLPFHSADRKKLGICARLLYTLLFREPPKMTAIGTVHFQGRKLFQNATDLHPQRGLGHLTYALKMAALCGFGGQT
jgi:hypothetical protein